MAHPIRAIAAIAATSLLPLLHPMNTHGYALEARGLLKTYGQPIHENITRKAATDAKLLSDEVFVRQGLKSKQEISAAQKSVIKALIEGVRFNDDPEGYLLPGTAASKRLNPTRFSPALGFAVEFVDLIKDRAHDPTTASHFGEYQYLHAMGSANMTPQQIKEKIERFSYHCWKMATEPDSFESFKKAYDAVSKKIEAERGAEPNEANYTPYEFLIRKTVSLFPKNVLFFHATNQIQFQYRALGALLHVIQDSYSKAHVVRIGWENGDNSGKIRYFQDYSQQDSNAHGELDHLDHGSPAGDGFLKVPGTAMAVERSKQILEKFLLNCPWSDAELVQHPQCEQSVSSLISDDIFAMDDGEAAESRATRTHPTLIKPEPAIPNGG